MNKQNKVILGVILLAVLLMAVAYAAVGTDTLNVKVTASGNASQDNFKVQFTGENTTKSENATVGTPSTPSIEGATANTEIQVNFNNMTAEGDTEYAILEIKNNSKGVVAKDVKISTDATDSEWFDYTVEMCEQDGTTDNVANTNIAVGATTYVKITAELLKTVTDTEPEESITVVLTATPEIN